MLHYLIRRILWAFPTILIVSTVVFGLNQCGNEEKILAAIGDDAGALDPSNRAQKEQLARSTASDYYLDKPAFYCTFTTAAFPDSVYRIFPPERRQKLVALTNQTGNWSAVLEYERMVTYADRLVNNMPDSLPAKAEWIGLFNQMITRKDTGNIGALLGNILLLKTQTILPESVNQCLDSLQLSFDKLCTPVQPDQRWMPAFYWHGADNQYHIWMSGLFSGNLKLTQTAETTVWEDIRPAFFPTLLLNLLAVLLAYGLAVPLGIWMARWRNTGKDRWMARILLLLYTMPIVWLGSILLLLFATQNEGLSYLPKLPVRVSPWDINEHFITWFVSNIGGLILPVIALTLSALAVLAMQLRGSMLEALGQDYIRTARAKGLAEHKIHWRHAFRNALFPLITIFAGVFPGLLAGSIVVEALFNVQAGMGWVAQQAFGSGNFAKILVIVMLGAGLTILGNLVADVLYAWADPRVRLAKN